MVPTFALNTWLVQDPSPKSCGNARAQDGGRRLAGEEAERVEMVPTFALNNAHFFCETADVSRGFPSGAPAGAPSWEFVWNRWLGAPLREPACPATARTCCRRARGPRPPAAGLAAMRPSQRAPETAARAPA